MSMPKQDLIRVRYDWDTNTWGVFVNTIDGQEFHRGGYELDAEAEEAKAKLLRQLAAAPNGDALSVLMRWEKGEK